MDLTAWLALVLVLAGWVVVFRQAVYLKNRDDTKSALGNIVTLIDEIYCLSKQYYSTDNSCHIGHLSAEIRTKFLLLSLYTTLFKEWGPRPIESVYVINLRKVVMGGYFETKDFLKQVELPNWHTECAMASSELRYKLEQRYIDWVKQRRVLGFTLY